MFNYLNKRRRKGQSTVEFAILIVIVIGALIAIQTYLKRGITGRVVQSADDIGDQYSAGNQNVVKIVTTNSKTNTFNLKGNEKTTSLEDENTITSMNTFIVNTTYEYWGP